MSSAGGRSRHESESDTLELPALVRRPALGLAATLALADRLLVPADQLEAIPEPLVEAEVVEGTEGRERGYLLARPPHKLRVERVLEAYDAGCRRLFEPLGEELEASLGALAARISAARARGLGELTLSDLVEGGEGAQRATETGRSGISGEAAGEE